jgi:hypothetical protein
MEIPIRVCPLPEQLVQEEIPPAADSKKEWIALVL